MTLARPLGPVTAKLICLFVLGICIFVVVVVVVGGCLFLFFVFVVCLFFAQISADYGVICVVLEQHLSV